MENKSLRIKILSGMLCTGLALSGSNISFAAVKNNGSTNEKFATNMNFRVSKDKGKVEAAKCSEIRTAELQEGLNILVANKVLTVEQKNKVLDAIKTRDAERKENYKKMKNMNEKERKDFLEKINKTKVNPMKVLIDNGTITKEQEEAIQEMLPQRNHGPNGRPSAK